MQFLGEMSHFWNISGGCASQYDVQLVEEHVKIVIWPVRHTKCPTQCYFCGFFWNYDDDGTIFFENVLRNAI